MTTEKRKLRNRLSQRAFRARQAMRMKELEDRLNKQPESEESRVVELEEQNTILRCQLLDCNNKLESLRVTLKGLSESNATALGLQAIDNEKMSDAEQYEHRERASDLASSRRKRGSSFSDTADEHPAEASKRISEGLPESATLTPTNLEPFSTPDLQDHDLDAIHAMVTQSSTRRFDPNQTMANSALVSPTSQLPLNFSFRDIGMSAFPDLVERSIVTFETPDKELRRTNSAFSDHISALEYFLRQKHREAGNNALAISCLQNSVTVMLSVFISMSWQSMTAWHAYLKIHLPLARVTMFRMNPTRETYLQVAENSRPSRFQLTHSHPSVIDWVPWASLRDKLILHHAANPRLDELICDIGNSYVTQTDLSHLVSGFASMTGYIAIWDLIRAISPTASSENSGSYLATGEAFENNWEKDALQTRLLPVPSVNHLFESRAAAFQAFIMLELDKGTHKFQLDPAFFGRHPELYESNEHLMAYGMPLRPHSRESMLMPRSIDASVVSRYRELTKWAVEMSYTSAGLPYVV